MGHGTKISGVNKTVKAGFTLVGGVQRKVKQGLTLVGGVQRKIAFLTFDPTFSNNDWSTIIAACESRSVPDTWKVGDTKTAGSYEFVIIGKNHDEYVGGSTKAPLTLQFKKSPGRYSISTATMGIDWSNCALRTTTLPTVLSSIPSEVQAGIKQVKKPHYSGSSLKYASDQLFILSAVELAGDNSLDKTTEGTQYEYYTTAANRKQATTYWTRSLYTSDSTRFVRVNTAGVLGSDSITSKHGIYPAFCF